ncbi:MAG: Flp family type IVb pilin [Rhizobiales bacterium]|nr:Flp family type IVb pilin [Hyphomicrobiales bacterium]
MATRIRRFIRDENGATAIEYTLIAALMSLALIPAMASLSTNITALFGQIAGFFALV